MHRPRLLFASAVALVMAVSASAYAAVYNVTLGSTSAALAGGTGSNTYAFTGTGSWFFQKTTPSGKFETYISPAATLGTTFTINDIASISYHTINGATNPSGVDYGLYLYTMPYNGGDRSWYGRRLTAEPYLSNGYVPPSAFVWNTWSTAAGANQLAWYDGSSCNGSGGPCAFVGAHSGNQGFYNAPTLADLQAGPFNWSAWGANPNAGSADPNAFDYGAQTVEFVSFQTGSGWSSFAGSLDAITIALKSGDVYNINLENVTDDQATPQAPLTCITPAHPCVSVPVTIARTSTTPMRGYSVNLQLSANLSLCGANIAQGSYLSGIGSTAYQVVNNGGGSYTVDCAILGGGLGATAASGTLFTVNVASGSPTGTGTVTVTGVTARDLTNGPIAVLAGGPANVTIQNTAPAAIGDLAATQVLTGNGSGSTTGIRVNWATGGTGAVALYRAPFGSYPEYDDDGPVSPPSAAAAPGAPWQLVNPNAVSPYVDNGASVLFSQGFETDDTQFNVLPGQYTAPRVSSGTHGVTSRTGSWHAEAGKYDLDVDGGSAFTRWGGYSFTFPAGGWTTQISVYLDCAYAATAGDKRIDFSSAVNSTSGFLRDFVFNMGTEPTGFVISAGNNAGRGGAYPSDPGHSPVHVTTSGWYTLQHRFYDNAGVLACDLTLLSPANTVVHTWTLSNPSDLIAGVGGNRYGWFAAQELPFLAIDDAKLMLNTTAPRGFWHYVAIVTDGCGNASAVSNMTGGTLNYLLGDVSNGMTAGTGNNMVYAEDISLLGAHYGIAGEAAVDAFDYLDVGPTITHLPDSRPKPDDRLGFEDLMIFAINYGSPGAQLMQSIEAAVADHDAITVSAPAAVTAGGTFTVELRMSGAGDIQGVSSQLAWDARVATPVAVRAGDLLTAADGVALSAQPGNVDVALLGSRTRGLSGEGVLATVTFRALASGDPQVSLAKVEARDAANQPVSLAGTPVGPATARETMLLPVTPNPFRDEAVLGFSLAKDAPVELAIYSVDGRRVSTIARGAHAAGVYHVRWDGTDTHGARVGSGVFYARLSVGGREFTRRLVYLK